MNKLSLFLLLIPCFSMAQVGIGTSTPEASARLQIDAASGSNAKGFLPPRVSLSATNNIAPFTATPATGILVYNTATGGTSPDNVTPGFYYYDGSKWQRIINQQPDATVEFNTASPNSTSPVPVFSPDVQRNTGYVYVSSVDNSQWTYNGTTYVTYTPPPSTAWYLSGGTTDAGSNKTGVLYRTGSVGIGAATTPNANAQLDVNSTTKGFLPPRMTSTQRNSIASPAGMMVYNNTDHRLDVLQNTTWRSLASLDGTETLTNKTLASPSLSLATITSGSGQYPSSLTITPTTHATSKRASIWIDGWSILQDAQGDGTKNFSIGQTVSGTYPVRFLINTSGNIGIGNTNPNAKLDIRTNPTSTSDPGAGYLAIGSTNTAANTAGAGAIRYSTNSGGVLEYSNGSSWNTLSSTVSKSIAIATKTSTQTIIDQTPTDITGWTEVVDNANVFDPTTGVFTAPRPGNYVFNFSYAFSNSSYGNFANLNIEAWMSCSDNTKLRKQLLAAPVNTSTRCGAMISFVVNLNSGETVRPSIWHATGASRSLETGFNNLSIVEL